ncbi:DUF1176 domain-containing protein [Nodosilinea nodulosa]|uniref:DUF1176 domain-containing protein n=1 Tax=Nodosilinea nodulosa TaxID=416001 RepID=UPI0002E35D0E|nr:DUF1176 domain-containing protein [Nodosilinea nodulosa]
MDSATAIATALPQALTRPLSLVVALVAIAIAGCNTPPATEAAPEEPETAPAAQSDLPAADTILQTVYDQEASLNLCDGFFQPEAARAGSQVYPLGDRALVELECTLAAYQAVYAYVVYQPDGTLQPLKLDVFYPNQAGQFDRTSEATVAGLVEFDPKQGLLTVFSKARGVGDCGSLAEYQWTGSELKLATFRYQECSDSPAEFVEPSDYPQIYP